jgi:class 3 adenylate cyclase/tetratricopeptide (TPR) repeat protein
MNCPRCGTENPDGAKFCLDCGSKLAALCPQCGTALPPQARFCTECGAQVRGSPKEAQLIEPDASATRLQRLVPKEYAERLLATRGTASPERRIVTVLFSDVKGSTEMAGNLDPEEWVGIMEGAFDLLIEPVYRYEGTVARLMGDAIVAFFGAPIAHEDDPERAIRAALDIVSGAQEYATRLEQERGLVGFAVRVGINTGLVVVGEVGSDLRMEYTAMGDAVNVAARMEQNAPPGGVLITDDTYRHVRGVFDVSPEAPLKVKGKAEPLQTYLVEGAKPRAFRSDRRGVGGVETRLVGREAELLTLQNAYEDVLEDGETWVVTVVGEAGVGKSRLLREFFDWAELRPEVWWYFRGQASSLTRSVPYSLWRDLFAFRFEIRESDGRGTALDKFREGMAGIVEPERADLVGHLVGFDFSASPAVEALLGSPNFRRLATAYLIHYFRGMLAQNPVVMVLEDLHWADDSSLDLLAHLVTEIPAAPLLVAGAARPGLLERRPSWGEGQAAYSRLELSPLSRRSSRALVAEILQRAAEVPEALRDLVVEGAEGNPFYIEELVKMLIEDGVILPGGDTWRVELARLAQVRVPPTLTGVLQARLDALPPAEKDLLQRAAVVGREFWDRLVGELAGQEAEGTVGPLLGSLRGRELVYRREQSAFAGTEEYIFKHAMLRDVTYETVLLQLRRRYHAQVAAWLEANAGERLGEVLSLIAGHYELAGDIANAAAYLRRSGAESYRVGAYRDASAAFERALALLPEGDSAGRSEALLDLGRAQMRLARYGEAANSLESGLALARTAGDRGAEVAALNGLGELNCMQGSLDTSEARLQAALALARGEGDRTGQALAQQHLARIAWKRGDYAGAESRGEASRALYQQLGNRQGEAAALNELGAVALLKGDPDRARRCFAENLALAQAMGDRSRAAQALSNLGKIADGVGDLAGARALFEQCLAIDKETGDRRGVVMDLNNLAYTASRQGAYDEAWAMAQQALVLTRQIGDQDETVRVSENLAEICIAQGQDGAAWGYLREALAEWVAMGKIGDSLYTLLLVARLRARAGRPAGAVELVGFILSHPAADSETQDDARSLLQELEAALPPGDVEAALARGAELDLEQAGYLIADPGKGTGTN